MNAVKASVAEAYPMATTYGRLGSIGLGHVINGQLYISGGNGRYCPDVQDLQYKADGGAGYRAAVASLGLPPAYDAVARKG